MTFFVTINPELTGTNAWVMLGLAIIGVVAITNVFYTTTARTWRKITRRT